MKLFGRYFGIHNGFKMTMSGGKDFFILEHGFMVSSCLGFAIGFWIVSLLSFFIAPKLLGTMFLLALYFTLVFIASIWSNEKRAIATHNFMVGMTDAAEKLMKGENKDNDGR